MSILNSGLQVINLFSGGNWRSARHC